MVGRHPIVVGALGGMTWGAVLRGWMRFISTHPEFSWSGTLFIVGASTLVGLVLGIAWWRWRAGGRGWWRLWGLATLPVFAGAGVVMLPSVLVGAVGIGRTHWPRGARLGLLGLAIGAQYAFFAGTAEGFPRGRLVPALVWYTVMIGIETWAFSTLFRSRVRVEAREGAMV
jgi:hypothetical protein